MLSAASDPEFMRTIETLSDDAESEEARDGTVEVLSEISGDMRELRDLLGALERQQYALVLAWFEREQEMRSCAHRAMRAFAFAANAHTDAVIDVLSLCIRDLRAQI